MFTPNVKAASFYEAEYLDNIYMNRVKNGMVYYQRGRVFREVGTERIAYCIEPFATFNGGSNYTSVVRPGYLSDAQRQRISLLAQFGYGYQNRTDMIWYAVTQLLIWEAGDPSGTYYFTDGLNGPRTSALDGYINELNSIINDFLKDPSFMNQTFDIVEGQSLTLTDTNNSLGRYTSTDNNVTINGNTLTIQSLNEGDYNFELIKNSSFYSARIFYYISDKSQDLIVQGDIGYFTANFKVSVRKTTFEIEKIDADTNSTTASGEGILQGAIYEVYNAKMELLETLNIGEDFKASIDNLVYGTYYIKEVSPGIGYELDEEIYEFVLNKDNPSVFLQLKNKIIEKKLEIHKEYGDGLESKKEEGIIFDIFNNKEDYVTTIVTDYNGYASIILPFGTYKIIQRNTTDGYQKVEDFLISVDEDAELEFHLYNYKIQVPDTGIDKKESNFYLFPILLLGIGIYQKRIFI